ncbi:hypothetical protein Q7P36_005945 [Cladosporium allicinum]
MSVAQQIGEASKPPDITRKVTACVACRKQKIKCHMRGSEPPCTRCKKRGLPCTVNRSLQTILESDGAWKLAVDRKIVQLESALFRVVTELRLPGLLNAAGDFAADQEDNVLVSTPSSIPSARAVQHNFELVMDPESGPAAIPGSVVSSAINSNEPARNNQNVVSRGIVTEEEAQKFLDVYQDRLDHFLYSILGDRRTLQQILSKSSLLLAAICAVGALHVSSPKFDLLQREFVSVASSASFSRQCTTDDVQGLCIGAFWLSGISWMCVGAAVRMSSELHLHRSIFKALDGDRMHYLNTRLYYLVYVCDHQFSVAFGRPPMTREDDAIRASSRFLDLEDAVEDDARLVSQVQFWVVGSDVYHTFGVDIDRPLDGPMIEALRRLSIRLDQIRADWTEKFTVNRYVGDYPKKGVGLHYHFARLYLFSAAFRGIKDHAYKAPAIAMDVDELADSAIMSATAILRTVTTDRDIQSYLDGLPTYFDVMIAFSVVFLLKVSTKYASTVRVDAREICGLVTKLVGVLETITATMHPQHLLVSVAKGSKDLLNRFYPAEGQIPMLPDSQLPPDQAIRVDNQPDTTASWPDISFEEIMGEFDFLSNQDTFNDFQTHYQYQ